MTNLLEKDDFLFHLRRLEDKYGQRLSNKGFDFASLAISDPDDYQAILKFRKVVKETRESLSEINPQKLEILLEQGCNYETIAKHYQCSPSTIARKIRSNPKLHAKYRETSIFRKRKLSSDKKKVRQIRKENAAFQISKIRFHKNMTMKAFAGEINKILGTTTCSGVSVSNWERAVSLPNEERLKAIAIIGNTTVNKLLKG